METSKSSLRSIYNKADYPSKLTAVSEISPRCHSEEPGDEESVFEMRNLTCARIKNQADPSLALRMTV